MQGNLFRIGTLIAAFALPCEGTLANETITYTYDELGRLVAVSTEGTVNNGQSISTSFDAAGNRTNYTVGGAGAMFSIANAGVTEGGLLSFAVSRSNLTTQANAVTYASTNGTGIAPGDYGAVSGTLTFAVGETVKTISVSTVDDALAEANETIAINLSAPTNGATQGVSSGTGTINDNDSASLSIGNAAITEGGSLSFTVTRSSNTSSVVSANYASASGTAVSGSDFTAASGTVSFAANQTTATLSIATLNDTALEAAETMTVTLSGPSSGANITNATGTGTINDNDAALAIANASVTEGGALAFTVTRSGTITTAVSASYSTTSGTATSGGDFNAATGMVSFAANQTTATINVTTIDDTVVETAETMSVTLSSPSADTAITTATGTGTINDNDVASAPSFSIADASGTEGDVLSFSVTKTGSATSAYSVSYATATGTAGTTDFYSTSGTLTFAANETVKVVNVTSKTDTPVEMEEAFYVNLANPTGGSTISIGQAIGTIFDSCGSALSAPDLSGDGPRVALAPSC